MMNLFCLLKKSYFWTIPTHINYFPTEVYRYTKRDANKIYSIITSGRLHQNDGTEVISLQKEFADYHHVNTAVATSSGTNAINLALQLIGLNPGDEVIVPAYMNISVAQAVLQQGGVPIFADIDETFTISPSSLKAHITAKTKAVIPVHMFGNVADMESIVTLAKKHSFFVIEDCCQAAGATYANKMVGSLGDIGCFSFSAKKAISAGEGGMIISSNKTLGKKLHKIIEEARSMYHSKSPSITTSVHIDRMTEMQAAIARSILSQLNILNHKRTQNLRQCTETLTRMNLPLQKFKIHSHTTPAISRFVFMMDFERLGFNRKTFIERVQTRGIPLKTFYPKPISSHRLFQNKYDNIRKSMYPFSLNTNINYTNLDVPFTNKFCQQMVGVNFSPYLQPKQISYLCDILAQSLRG